MEVRVSLTLNATNFVLNRRVLRACALLSVLSAAALQAQVVKAPRYTGGLDAPTPQLALPPLPPAITPHGMVVEDIVVRVNDQIISRSDVDRQAQTLNQAAAAGNVPKDQIATEQKNMLRDMIDQQLLLSRGKELGLNVDSDVIRQLDEIRQKNNFKSMDELEAAARKEGVNFEDFKAQIHNQLLTQMVVRDEVGRKIQMTQGEAQKYYDEHKDQFQQPEQIKLSEILIPTPENATPAQITQAEAKAKDVKGQADKGADFAELAKKYSGGPSAAQGGELGVWKRGGLAKVLEDATFDLKVGDSTQPIRTRQGFVILKVTEHDQAGPAPLKDVVQQVEEAMYMQQMQPALRAYLTKLRVDSYVEIQPGFVDSGASADEVKFANTAYAPPPVKKKVVKPAATTRFDRTVKPLVSSPDTTGGRTLTGKDAAEAGVDPNTGLAVVKMPPPPPAAPRSASGKKLKREKIRYGQAPRNALPSGSTDASIPDSAPGTPGVGQAAAPGAVMASNGTMPTGSNLEDNPLTPAAPEHEKTRFAAAQKKVEAKKVTVATAKQTEKLAAKPTEATAEEKASTAAQAAPLGLAGDTKKKPAKPKRVKGQAKPRLEEKPKAVPVAPAPVDQTVNPALAPTAVSPAPATATPPPAPPPEK
jgi:peptidyl-prolyl cis-trans isomerase SurA